MIPSRYRSREEERYLIYAAIGRSGRNLGDMQFVGRPGTSAGQGHALMNFKSRTVPSPCSAQSTQLFYTYDDGVFFVADAAGPDHPWDLEVVQLQSSRLEIPREAPFMLPFNQWYTNRPGTTLFMPVTNIALLYLNLLLTMFSEDTGYFIVDTDNGNAACGLDAFRKSAGGHLHDNLASRKPVEFSARADRIGGWTGSAGWGGSCAQPAAAAAAQATHRGSAP